MVERERTRGEDGDGKGEQGDLCQRTRWNVIKALRYRSVEDLKRFGEKVQEHRST